MSEPRSCCQCCCGFIFTLGLTSLFMWLTLRVSNPSCSIDKFYLPALNRSADSPTNTTIFMVVKLRNGNKDKGILYDAVNLTVYYYSDANPTKWLKTIPAFKQGHQKTAKKNASVETLGVNWTDVVAKNESVVFRVDLATAVRFKIMFWKTKRHKLMVGANVTLNQEGSKMNKKKGIKLKSGVGKNMGGCCFWQMGISVVAVAFILLD